MICSTAYSYCTRFRVYKLLDSSVNILYSHFALGIVCVDVVRYGQHGDYSAERALQRLSHELLKPCANIKSHQGSALSTCLVAALLMSTSLRTNIGPKVWMTVSLKDYIKAHRLHTFSLADCINTQGLLTATRLGDLRFGQRWLASRPVAGLRVLRLSKGMMLWYLTKAASLFGVFAGSSDCQPSTSLKDRCQK